MNPHVPAQDRAGQVLLTGASNLVIGWTAEQLLRRALNAGKEGGRPVTPDPFASLQREAVLWAGSSHMVIGGFDLYAWFDDYWAHALAEADDREHPGAGVSRSVLAAFASATKPPPVYRMDRRSFR